MSNGNRQRDFDCDITIKGNLTVEGDFNYIGGEGGEGGGDSVALAAITTGTKTVTIGNSTAWADTTMKIKLTRFSNPGAAGSLVQLYIDTPVVYQHSGDTGGYFIKTGVDAIPVGYRPLDKIITPCLIHFGGYVTSGLCEVSPDGTIGFQVTAEFRFVTEDAVFDYHTPAATAEFGLPVQVITWGIYSNE